MSWKEITDYDEMTLLQNARLLYYSAHWMGPERKILVPPASSSLGEYYKKYAHVTPSFKFYVLTEEI